MGRIWAGRWLGFRGMEGGRNSRCRKQQSPRRGKMWFKLCENR